jgi:cyclohexyl-isocyanide hydratase
MKKRRVVRDGNVITAGGVTSGIDFGLEVVADIAGEAVARSIQLSLEYDPNPLFISGHPDRATAETVHEVGPRYEERRADFRDGIGRLATA